MSRISKRDKIITEQSGDKGLVVDIDPFYIYVLESKNNKRSAFDYAGLKRWLKNFVKGVINENLTLSCNADCKMLIPAKTWIQGIRLKGSATGITLTVSGTSYSISSCATGYEIIPRRQYIESDTYIDITATSWGKLDIIIFI